MFRRLVVLAVLVAAPLRAQTASPTPSVDDRLRALEERVKTLEAENASLRADVSPKPNTAAPVKALGKEQEIKVGGLLQVQAEAGGRSDSRFTDDNDRLYLRRARINVSGRFLEDIEWKTELELAGSLANASGLRAQMTDGYIGWKQSDRFDIRAGQFKTPFGYEQLFPDPRLSFAERSLGSDRLTLSRQLGVQLGGSAAGKRFTWNAGAFNGAAQNTSGNDDDHFVVMARASGTAAAWRAGKKKEGRLSLGAGAYSSADTAVALASDFKFDSNTTTAGNDNIFHGDRRAWSADLQVAHGPFELWTEWIETDFRPDTDLPLNEFAAKAGMAQATWMLMQDRLQVGVRWDEFDPNTSADDDGTTTWTNGLTWLIRGHDLKLQANWMHANGPKPLGDEDTILVRFQVGF